MKSPPCEIREQRGKDRHRGLGDEHQLAAIEHVGGHAAQQRKDDDGDNAHEADDAQGERPAVFRNQQRHVPQDRSRLHEAPGEGDEEPNPEQAEIAVAEGGEQGRRLRYQNWRVRAGIADRTHADAACAHVCACRSGVRVNASQARGRAIGDARFLACFRASALGETFATRRGMIWFFQREHDLIVCEVRKTPDDTAYEFEVAPSNAPADVRHFDSPHDLIEAYLGEQRRLLNAGWRPTAALEAQ